MQTTCQKIAHDKIPEHVPGASSVNERSISDKLNYNVENCHLGNRKTVVDSWADSIEQDLKGAEESLS